MANNFRLVRCTKFSVKVRLGGASPPITNMQILLWTAQIVIDLLKARNGHLAKELEVMAQEAERLNEAILDMKEQNKLYQESLNAIRSANQLVEEKVLDAKARLAQLKMEQDEIIRQTKTTTEDILRFKI